MSKKLNLAEHNSTYNKRVEDHDDINYFDATILNNNVAIGQQMNIISTFRTQLQKIFIEKPQDYYLAIARFSISHMTIPILFFRNNFYSLTISNVGSSQQFLTYLPAFNNNSETQFGFPVGSQPIYYYEQFVTVINAALANAYVGAGGAVGQWPFISYNANTERFDLFIRPADIGNFDIHFNSNLFQLFQYFPAVFNGFNSANGEDYSLTFNSAPNQPVETHGGIQYLVFTQERSALYLFNEIQNIIFTTNDLPVNYESIELNSRNNNGSPIQQNILADFVPDLSKGRDLSEYQYYPQGPYRLIDLTDANSIRSININIGVVARDGTVYPLYLEPGEVIKVKLVFFKKDSLTW